MANCIQYTILVWIAFFFILFSSFCHTMIVIGNRHKNHSNPWTWLNLSKLGVSTLISGTAILSYIITNGSNTSEQYTAGVLIFLASCALSALIIVDKKFGVTTSGYIYLSWLVLAFCGIVRYIFCFTSIQVNAELIGHFIGSFLSENVKNSILFTSLLCFKDLLLAAITLNAVAITLQFVGPQILKFLLSYIQDPTKPIWLGLSVAFFMFVCDTLQTFCQQQQMYRMFLIAFRLKSVLMTSIYSKALRISEQNSGNLVNYVTSDVQRIVNIISRIQMIWTSPLQIILALYFLWKTLGWPTLVGFCGTLIFIPFNFCIARLEQKYETLLMTKKDIRMKTLSEMLNGVKVIKLYAWELSFQDRLNEFRREELRILKIIKIVQAVNTFTMFSAPLLVAVISFAAFVFTDPRHILTPEIAFVSLALFNLLRQPLNDFPPLVSGLIQANVSRRRLEEFLTKEELNKSIERNENVSEIDHVAISIRNGRFKYNKNMDNLTLTNVNLSIKTGQLVAVVGQVGAGKTALLLALLREIYKVQGSITIEGSVAYVPQQAWIRNATVRDNIIIAKGFNSTNYHKIIQACALQPDLTTLPNKDETEIGEKGVNLSGGQKQRISLARAIYQNSDIYFLDDPLSAVDVHVGRHIFDNVISNQGLLQKKTRLFVTHNLLYLKCVDLVVVIKNGHIAACGTLNELKNKDDSAFLEALNSESHSVENEEISCSEPFLENNQIAVDKDVKTTEKPVQRIGWAEKEKIETGQVSYKVYFDYAKAIGLMWCIGLVLLFSTSTAFGIASNIWLAKWTDDSSKNFTRVSPTTRLSVFFSLGLFEGLVVFIAAVLTAYATIKSSSVLHSNALFKVVRSPLSFFEVTPIGVIFNRFGADFESIDGSLPYCIQFMTVSLLKVVSTLIIVVISSPVFAAVIIPLAFFYYFVQKFFISTARQLKRLMSASNSPVISFLSESVQGAASIRAYKVEKWFMAEFFQRMNYSQMTWYPIIVSNRWLALNLQFVGNCIVFSAALFAVVMRERASDAGLLGLAITCALSVTYSLVAMVRSMSEIETNIVSVERIKEYTELQSEAEWKNKIPLPDSWPKRGKIEFSDYSTRYRPDLDLSVKHFSCLIAESHKIGIVGRTGAGKSSLSMAIFRIIEPLTGKIFIDDIDISTLGLHDLRSRIAIIPQDPVLFSGTVRSNLDPFNKFTDAEMWSALENSGLNNYVSEFPHKLEHEVFENGANFSVGQRQLFCLARALLKNSKIIVLDEATAAVDIETEKLILQSISKYSNCCTILTIAHRLNTIMNSDWIMVLGDGNLLEYGKTRELLQNPSSLFYAMANDNVAAKMI